MASMHLPLRLEMNVFLHNETWNITVSKLGVASHKSLFKPYSLLSLMFGSQYKIVVYLDTVYSKDPYTIIILVPEYTVKTQPYSQGLSSSHSNFSF